MKKVNEVDEARIAREHAQRIAALWLKPAASDREAAVMMGVPYSTWCAQKKKPGFPPHFRIGRRRFYRIADLRAYIDAKAA